MVIFHAYMPPPISGMPHISQNICKTISSQESVLLLDTNPLNCAYRIFQNSNRVLFYIRRIVRFVRIWSILIYSNSIPGKNIYFALDDNFAMLFSAISIAISVKRSGKVWVHHHSYRYLDRRSKILAALTKLAPNLIHIVLCPIMERKLQSLYPGVRHTKVLNNAFSVPSGSFDMASSKKIRLGHLSNLSADKGFFFVVSLFEKCRREGLPVELRIAGPVACNELSAAIKNLRTKYKNEFIYYGPVYGEQKTSFYSNIDCFIFPSFYKTEAQPLALLEAMSSSVIPLASSVGGIPYILEKAPIAPIRLSNFIDEAFQIVCRYANQPELLAFHKAQCRNAFVEMKQLSLFQLGRLIKDIVHQSTER